jgi:hypothetical protein
MKCKNKNHCQRNLRFINCITELIPKLIITSMNSELLIVDQVFAYENDSKNVINVKIRLILGLAL